MPVFPPMPTWGGLHPVVVHFPIALLLVLPVLIVIGLAAPRWARQFSAAALVLMIIGTGFLLLAMTTGESAEEGLAETGALGAALERHEELAESARAMFLALTSAFAAFLLAAWTLKGRMGPRAFAISSAVFLVPYLAGMVLLVNVGHEGGRLVHELDVHQTASAAPAPPPTAPRGHEDD